MPPPVTYSPTQIANYFPEMSPELRQVLEGYYLGEGNPYTDQIIKQLEQDAQRNYSTSIAPMQRSSLGMSGAYGTALGDMAMGRTAEDFNRALMGQMAQTRGGFYESERDRMAEALRLYSGETIGSRQDLTGMRGQDIGLQQTGISAAAQRAAANAAAGASRYGADRSYQLGRENLQYNYWRDLMERSQGMNFWNSQVNPQEPGGFTPPAGAPAFGGNFTGPDQKFSMTRGMDRIF